MPFTLAHPAVVVPLARRWPDWLPLSALVMGALAPDLIFLCSLPYVPPDRSETTVAFLGLFPIDQQYGHAWPGLLRVSFPTALAMLALYHGVLKWPLVSLFPPALRARLVAPAAVFSWTRTPRGIDSAGRATRIALAILVGLATHVLWDGFTHREGWATRFLPGLLYPIAGHGRSAMTLAEGEQIACSVLGLALIARWARLWLRAAAPAAPAAPAAAAALAPWRDDRARVALLTLAGLAVAMIAAARGLWTYHHMEGAQAVAGGISIGGLWLVRLPAAFLALYSLAWWTVIDRAALARALAPGADPVAATGDPQPDSGDPPPAAGDPPPAGAGDPPAASAAP
jgi:hypothetical protein